MLASLLKCGVKYVLGGEMMGPFLDLLLAIIGASQLAQL